VVMAIITILAAITFTVVLRARYAPYVVSCKSNLRQIVIAVRSYEGEHGHLPPWSEMTRLDLACPLPGAKEAYQYYETAPGGVLVVCQNHRRTSGVVLVGRLDGSVVSVPNGRYQDPQP